MYRRLKDEPSGEEQTLTLSGSLKKLSVQPDPDADRPQTQLQPDLGRPRLLSFVLTNLIRETTIKVALFR